MPTFEALFLRHPREQNETYLEHAGFAAATGALMAAGGLACLIHAVLPCAFATTGSRMLARLGRRMARRGRAMSVASPTPNGRSERFGLMDLGAGI